MGLCLGFLFLTVSGILFWQSLSLTYSSDLGPGPGLFPRWLSAALMLLSLLYIAGSVRGERIMWSEVMPKGKDLRNVGMVLVAVLIFILLLSPLGFIMSGSIMLVILLIRSYKWYWTCAIAVGTSLFLYFVFSTGLDVPLPTGDLWEWIGG
jgi:putative tricarboxylic transport membrane protein